jgi:hypothetical protein
MPVPAVISAVSTTAGGVSLFGLGSDNQVWCTFYDPSSPGPTELGGWRPWFPLGPNRFPPGSTITAVSTKERGTSLFVVGLDGLLWSTFFDPANLGPADRGGWQPWFALGAQTFPLGTGVGAVSTRHGGVDVFVLDADGGAWTIEFDPGNLGPASLGGWQPWLRLGANQFTSPGAITAVSTKPGGASLFVHGFDGQVWSSYRDPSNLGPASQRGWQGWFPLGPNTFPTPSTISAVSTTEGGVSLFTLGYDGKVWSRFYDPRNLGPADQGGWQGWFALGDNTFPRPGAVTAISSKPAGVSLFTTGFDSKVWSCYFDPDAGNRWSSWFPLDFGTWFPTPQTITATSSRPGGTSLFGVGGDSLVRSLFFDPQNPGPAHQGGWHGWFVVGDGRPFPSADRVRCIRLHAKILSTPNMPITRMIACMDAVFQQTGVRVRHIGNEWLNLPTLTAVNVGDCSDTPSADVNALFQNANGVGDDDVVAYFVAAVNQTSGGALNGCATHPPGRDGATIAAIASRWTLAHEIAHVMGLPHTDDPPPPDPAAPPAKLDFLMTGRGTGGITNPPPDLDQAEINSIGLHPLATDGTRT